jgi:fused signal recognition particle receptor
MGFFWRRKSKDQFVTLGLNEPVSEAPVDPGTAAASPSAIQPASQEPRAQGEISAVTPQTSSTSSAATTAVERDLQEARAREAAPPKPARARTPFATSVLGLNLTIEELQAQEAALEQEFSARFRRAVAATRDSLSQKLDTVFQGRKQIDEDLLEELEEALIATDIGVATTLEILETVRRGIARKQINDIEALKQAIKSELRSILEASERHGVASETSVPDHVAPYVMMIVGVNGVGKTTTIGKLAQRIKAEGNDVLICAADTFRAAASDQLAIWAERTGVPLIQQKQGTDPAAVLFDSLKAAKARSSDVLIVDTAGRLHTKSNLMAELEKMKRVAGREVEGAPHETLLVLDAVTGQNGLEQARQFLKVAGVTGIVLTKLDGTAKGGIAVAIAKELNLPIRYAGIGEKLDDLVVFNPQEYVNGLFN